MKNTNKQIIINNLNLPVACDGSKLDLDPALKVNLHPKVYINLTHNKLAVCPYCGIQYILTTDP